MIIDELLQFITRLPNNSERTHLYSSQEINDKIQRETLLRIQRIGLDPVLIEERLKEIDHEWDIDRALAAYAMPFNLFGALLGFTVNKKWFLLSALVSGFVFQHAIKGWGPPTDTLRRMGFRTSREIENERFSLKALRGDFQLSFDDNSPLNAYEAALR